MTVQSLFRGIAVFDFWAKWVFIASAGALAFTGGLALACFVKAFGVTFLARPRGSAATAAKESSASFHIGMGALALLSLLFGLLSAPVLSFISGVGRTLAPFCSASSGSVAAFSLQGITVGDFSFVSPLAFGALFIGLFIIVMVIVKRFVNAGQKIRIGSTWDCGADLTPRMEINSTGFAHSLIMIFKGILKPSIQHETEYHDDENRYIPKSRRVTMNMDDLHLFYLYRPVRALFARLSVWAKTIQSGNINLYILYIFLALLAALALVK
jgi:hydrogenase-4 component B